MAQQSAAKPELGRLIPGFSLRNTDDEIISPWDFKEKKNLVIVFFDPDRASDREALAMIGRRATASSRKRRTEILGIAGAPLDEIEAYAIELPFRMLTDPSGEVRCAYNAAESSMFVADRFGELVMKSELAGDLNATLDHAPCSPRSGRNSLSRVRSVGVAGGVPRSRADMRSTARARRQTA